jgi:hypothetical protein
MELSIKFNIIVEELVDLKRIKREVKDGAIHGKFTALMKKINMESSWLKKKH